MRQPRVLFEVLRKGRYDMLCLRCWRERKEEKKRRRRERERWGVKRHVSRKQIQIWILVPCLLQSFPEAIVRLSLWHPFSHTFNLTVSFLFSTFLKISNTFTNEKHTHHNIMSHNDDISHTSNQFHCAERDLNGWGDWPLLLTVLLGSDGDPADEDDIDQSRRVGTDARDEQSDDQSADGDKSSQSTVG